jgi:hypothetical protein
MWVYNQPGAAETQANVLLQESPVRNRKCQHQLQVFFPVKQVLLASAFACKIMEGTKRKLDH